MTRNTHILVFCTIVFLLMLGSCDTKPEDVETAKSESSVLASEGSMAEAPASRTEDALVVDEALIKES